MLISENALFLWGVHLKLQATLGTAPFTLIQRRNFQLVSKPTAKIQRQKGGIFPGVLYTVILYVQLFSNRQRVPSVVTFDSSMYCLSHVSFFIIKYIIIKRNENLVEQFNCLISHEVRHALSNKSNFSILGPAEKILVALVQLCGIITGIMIPCAYTLVQIIVPCSPSTFAYFLNPECTQLASIQVVHRILSVFNIPVIVYRLAAVTINWLITLDTLGMFAFVVMQLFFTQSYTLIYFIRLFRLDFLRNLNFGVLNSNFVHKQLPVYRELQLHSLFFNKMHQDCGIISVMCCIMYAFVISVFALMEYGSQLAFPQIVVFGNVALATFIAMVFVYGIFAKVNTNSLKALAFLQQRLVPSVRGNRGLHVWTSKYIASLPQLKVQIGSTNFVDSFTPLAMLQFCLGQICNLMLM